MDRDKLIEELAREHTDKDRCGCKSCTETMISEVLSRLDELGLCIVPREPSEAMLSGLPRPTMAEDARNYYRAMLDAASKQ